MRDYRTNPDRIDPDHALTRAAREVNNYTEEHGLEACVQWLNMDATLEQVRYLGEQRALRAFAAKYYHHNMGFDPVKDEAIAKMIVMSPMWQILGPLIVAVYMDGIAIGWRGAGNSEEQ